MQIADPVGLHVVGRQQQAGGFQPAGREDGVGSRTLMRRPSGAATSRWSMLLPSGRSLMPATVAFSSTRTFVAASSRAVAPAEIGRPAETFERGLQHVAVQARNQLRVRGIFERTGLGSLLCGRVEG